MPGLFGVIDLRGGRSAEELQALADAMEARLTRSAGYRTDWQFSTRAVIGRTGAPHHNPEPWSGPNSTAIAGIVHREPAANAVTSWNGFFATYAEEAGSIQITVDRRATVPVFHARHDGLLLFAPEVKALLALRDLPRDIDEAALAQFMASGYLAADQTLLRSVRRLRGGYSLRVLPDGEIRIERYWQFRPGGRANGASERDLAESLGALIAASVRRNLKDPERSFILLSGGADSRAILGGALEALAPNRITTATWVGESGSSSDLELASKAVTLTGVRHRVLKRSASDYGTAFDRMNRILDGLSDLAGYHAQQFRLMEEMGEAGFTTALRGDEVFGWWLPVKDHAEALAAIGLHAFEDVGGLPGLVRPELRPGLALASRERLSSLLDEVADLSPDAAKDRLYFEHRLQGFLGSSYAYKQVVLEQRNALLDHEILDFMEQVPDRFRVHKQLLHRAMELRHPQLWALGFAGPVQAGWGTNIEDWSAILRQPGPIRTFVYDRLSDRQSRIWEVIDRERIATILERLNRPAPPSRQGWRERMRRTARAAYHAAPQWLTGRLRFQRLPQPSLSDHRAVMRALALQHWQDELRNA